ncbi:MAG: hypothetical protein HZB83_03925, partial [Deltaproteobacteria bacterium]|nr:hypothetical protein [Deltaproteobacteria bacterium]
MSYIKKSLRAKFTIALFLVGIIPLTSASVFFYYTSRDALFQNVFKELKWSVNESASSVEALFSDAGKDLLLASQNIAFKMYFMDRAQSVRWLAEQKKTLKHLRSIYPDMLDEACYIDATGQEVSRIVLDRLAEERELSSEEERTTFFKGSFEVDEGAVYVGRPTVSEDTKRWVLPHGTPVEVDGRKAAI